MATLSRHRSRIPLSVILFFIAFLAIQIGFKLWQDTLPGIAAELQPAPSYNTIRGASFGDEITLARWLLLWLQSFDNQPGVSISYHDLNFESVTSWLTLINKIDPATQYPLMLASRVYGSVDNEKQRRIMLSYIYDRYLEYPNHRWRWLAEATLIAKHGLNDLPLALKFATALHEHSTADHIPYWAKDMKIILLEDMNELESATVLIGGLIESGEITDKYELNYLTYKLEELQEKINQQPKTD